MTEIISDMTIDPLIEEDEEVDLRRTIETYAEETIALVLVLVPIPDQKEEIMNHTRKSSQIIAEEIIIQEGLTLIFQKM